MKNLLKRKLFLIFIVILESWIQIHYNWIISLHIEIHKWQIFRSNHRLWVIKNSNPHLAQWEHNSNFPGSSICIFKFSYRFAVAMETARCFRNFCRPAIVPFPVVCGCKVLLIYFKKSKSYSTFLIQFFYLVWAIVQKFEYFLIILIPLYDFNFFMISWSMKCNNFGEIWWLFYEVIEENRKFFVKNCDDIVLKFGEIAIFCIFRGAVTFPRKFEFPRKKLGVLTRGLLTHKWKINSLRAILVML